MITIDFIPPTKLFGEYYDTVLTITDKVSRAVILSPGKETWSAAEYNGQMYDVYNHHLVEESPAEGPVI
jgi:hypothetical protein